MISAFTDSDLPGLLDVWRTSTIVAQPLMEDALEAEVFKDNKSGRAFYD